MELLEPIGLESSMELTKHIHACVTLDKEGSRLLIDPGAFTPNAAELAAGAGTILITHEHFDHFDQEMIAAALDARPDLRVYGPEAVVGRWSGRPGQVTAVAPGERFDVDGFDVSVFGGTHALIHRDVPQVVNVGYLVDGRVYHPGDSYFVPDAPVTTLLVPTSGPWTKLGEAVDFVRAVGPEQAVQIHEIMLSEVGQQSMALFLSPKMLTPDVSLTILPLGDTITV
jgi:L-ascorbate metabolism protein UlaG (beta-lactamase superfamily)